MADPGEVLSSTEERSNFQRLARLLIAGGTALLREVFDTYCPPSDLPKKLQDPSTLKELKYPKLTKQQWDILKPSTGVYGKSEDFDITLLFRLLSTPTICSLTPPCTGWNAEPASGDHSLAADLLRIKQYRNKLVHANGAMDFTADEFRSTWSEIREAIVRIAGNLSTSKKNEWQGAIDNFLTSPLTEEESRYVEELKMWYRRDMELTKSVEVVLQVLQATRDEMKELTQLMQEKCGLRDTVAESSAGVPSIRIHIEAIPGSGPQGGSTGNESEDNTARDVTTNRVRPGENVGNSSSPYQDFMLFLARRYVQAASPSTMEELYGLLSYLQEVRNLILTDVQIGSLIITVECRSLQILNDLRKELYSDNLSKIVERFLVTDDTLKAFAMSDVKILTAIEEKEFRICEQYFLERQSGGSTVSNKSKRGVSEALKQSHPSTSQGTLDVAYDTAEPESKRRKRDAPEDQSNSLSSESQVKGKQSTRSTEVSTEITRSLGRISEGKSTSTFRTRKGSPTGGKGKQPSIRSPRKQRISDGEFCYEVVFALDYSSSVSDEEFQKEHDFVRQMSNSWSLENELGSIVVYGNVAETVAFNAHDETFSNELQGLKIKEWRQSKGRRMDLALKQAADFFTLSADRHIVILITAGRQVTGEETKEDNRELLLSATEALSSKNVKVIVVPIGMETDFRELGLIVKRPQYLFPLSSFDDVIPKKASTIASYIMETLDPEIYAKNKVDQFSVISETFSLWENSSLCSDVLEGAWYELYDQKKSSRQEKIKGLIRESIDNFQNTLVTEGRVCITIAVLGPLGTGKSFVLNSLLNAGLTGEFKVESGPLPSAPNDSQTPLPIYVKYGRRVQVSFHKQEGDPNPVEWFPEEDIGTDTLARLNSTLLTRFRDKDSFTRTSYVEVQGPFPVFSSLKTRKMTSQDLHLELDVDVQFLDVPGLGDNTGNESISETLNKADVVLFFDSGQSGRPVSAEDIAQVFRRCDAQFQFVSRPKLVHIINDRNPIPPPLDKLDDLHKEKKSNLDKAWSCFLSSIREDDGIYKEVREKLPKLNSEDLLDKMSKESECIYFHAENTDFASSLKKVVDEHVRNVKIKQTIHPFLQNVLWAAKMLKKRIVDVLYARKKKWKPVEVNLEEVIFEMMSGMYEAEEDELITSFVEKTPLPLEDRIVSLLKFLHNSFLLSSETQHFLLKILRKSLKTYASRLFTAILNSNLTVAEDAPEDILTLIEHLSITKVEQFCANLAPTFLLQFLNNKKKEISLSKDEMSDWELSSADEKPDLVKDYLRLLLDRAKKLLEDNRTRAKQASGTSHFKFMKRLQERLEKLLAESSFADAYKTTRLESLKEKLPTVIKFCNDTIREINPHPNVDVDAIPSLPPPEEMRNAKKDDKKIFLSSYEGIIGEVTKLLLNPGKNKAKEIVKKMETMLKFKHGHLDFPKPKDVDEERLWASALLNVLSDEDHFGVQPKLAGTSLDLPDIENKQILNIARERLFAHQKSSITCKIVKPVDEQSLPEDEIRLKMNGREKCLEALISSSMCNKLDAIRLKFREPTQQIAPIFIPIIRPGPTPDIQGNYFLDENPWSKTSLTYEENEEKDEETKRDSNQSSGLELNIFLVVEPNHLKTLKSTINSLPYPTENEVNLTYVVLPQNGRGTGVTRSIIKSLAESFNFSLYWTVDDNVQFMYLFVEDDRRWHKCPLTFGLLFGQRVFQSCLEKTVKQPSKNEIDDIIDSLDDWESWAQKSKRIARRLLFDSLSQVQKNPNLLHIPFANISEVCLGDHDKEVIFMEYERHFVAKCRELLFEDTINHISGVSLAHVKSKGSDLMSRYPKDHYMHSDQLSQVVLNNTCALRGRNFVSDEMVLWDEEMQVYNADKYNAACWGIKGSEESFHRALAVSGVVGYRVIRIVYKEKKLGNAFDRAHSSSKSGWLDRFKEDVVEDVEDIDMADYS